MSKKFDEYLNKGGFTDEDRKAAQVEKAEDVARDQSPSDTRNSYTPNTRDAGKQERAGQEATVEQSGQTLKDQGVEPKDSLAKYVQTSQQHSKEAEQEQEPEL